MSRTRKVPMPNPSTNTPAEPTARALLVDANVANLLALEAVLEGLGYDLVQARSGEEALHLLHRHEFAVVLLDLQMPCPGGFETAKRIRGRGRRTPIIFLTARDD